MSQFDFPRIHFSGKTIIDPATGNNNYHYPLVTFEPISGTVVLPPRIYLNQKDFQKIGESLDVDTDFKKSIDEDGRTFLLIDGIDSPEKFKSWMTTPLGEHESDQNFHKIYKFIVTEKEGKPLSGLCPAYWNYYGTMNFELHEVKVHSVQIFENGKIETFTTDNNTPSRIAEILDSSLSFKDTRGKNRAVMIDVSPTLSLFSQVFCDRMVLQNANKVIFAGKPLKSGLRQMNSTRTVNVHGIKGSSGIFYTSIKFTDLEENQTFDLAELFNDYSKDNREIIGISIRYDLFGVEEDQNPNYTELGTKSNPALSSILGTISPLYKGDLQTGYGGRLLTPIEDFLTQKKMGSAVAHFNTHLGILSLDLIGSLPIKKDEVFSNNYDIFNLGNLYVGFAHHNSGFHLISEISIGIDHWDMDYHFKNGGICDISIANKEEILSFLAHQEGEIILKITNHKDCLAIGLKESVFHILSEQTGIYADQYDDEEIGYLSNSNQREHCVIQVYKYGQIYDDPIKIMIGKIGVSKYGIGESVEILNDIETVQNGQILKWSTKEAGQFFFALVPVEEIIIPHDFKYYMVVTGAFVNLRVLKKFEYNSFINNSNPDSGNEIDFKLVYDELLMHYDLIYPSSGIITPFTQPHFQRIRNYLKEIMVEAAWNTYLYMPSSRDMPKGKQMLLFEWIDQQILKEKTNH